MGTAEQRGVHARAHMHGITGASQIANWWAVFMRLGVIRFTPPNTVPPLGVTSVAPLRITKKTLLHSEEIQVFQILDLGRMAALQYRDVMCTRTAQRISTYRPDLGILDQEALEFT